jgi:hypothetical protein
MLGNMASAKQKIAKDTKGSRGAYAALDGYQKKEVK